jgi:uncharacterized protein YqjF (DUF2071 family)
MSVFLTAEWRDLAVLTYSIDPVKLQAHLPPGLQLDSWEGQAIVSLVGFRFLHTRVIGCRIPFWGSFPEVNLRFYVRRDTAEGERRGVIFIKEIVPYYPVAAVARGFYNENYHSMPMSQDVTPSKAEYRWQSEGRENRLAVFANGLPTLPDDDSLDTFIVDHHWGYARTKNGGCMEYEVDRRPWRTYPVERFEVDVDVERLYGAEFAEALSKPPISVVLAEGSKVSVSFGKLVAWPAA